MIKTLLSSLDSPATIGQCMPNKVTYLVPELKGEVRRKMNFIYVLGFVVLRVVVKVFPVSSSSFARKKTGRN